MISVDQTITVRSETVEDTIAVLNKNNIFVDKKLIPVRMKSMRKLEMYNSLQEVDLFAQAILGGGYHKTFNNNVYEFSKDSKTLIIEGIKFNYYDYSPNNAINDLSEKNVEAYAKKILSDIKIDYEDMAVKNIEKKDNEYYSITLIPRYQGKEIYGCYIKMNISKNGLSYIEGYWLTPGKYVSDFLPVRSITGILIDFIGNFKNNYNKPITITDISIGFFVDTSMISTNLKTIEAEPVWQITTDDGNTYFYDTISGERIGGGE